jgi:cell wall-associated NlpC family hydrolase
MLTEEQKKIVIETANSYLDVPYDRGANEIEGYQKIDCSLLTQLSYKKISVVLERSSILQAADKKAEEVIPKEDYSNLEIGDLIFFRSDRGFYYDELFDFRKIYIGHVGIYFGDGKIIHARKSKGKVLIEYLEDLKKENPDSYTIVLVKRY